MQAVSTILIIFAAQKNKLSANELMRTTLNIFILMLVTSCLMLSCNNAKSETSVKDDIFTTKSGKTVTFKFIKHGSLEIRYDTLSIQVDPVEALPPETDYSKFDKADYILVTHEHFDHFDSIAIATLCDSQTMILTNAAVRSMLKRGTEMANGTKLLLRDDITIEAVPAYNTTPSHANFHPKGRDNGYVLSLDGLRIYIAGDTEDVPEMSGLQNIDIAFLPCNQPYTMTPEQFAHAATMIKPKVVYPYHYNETPVEQIVKSLKDEPGIDVRIRQMK